MTIMTLIPGKLYKIQAQAPRGFRYFFSGANTDLSRGVLEVPHDSILMFVREDRGGGTTSLHFLWTDRVIWDTFYMPDMSRLFTGPHGC